VIDNDESLASHIYRDNVGLPHPSHLARRDAQERRAAEDEFIPTPEDMKATV
jgi:hypothetical protein